MKGDPIIVTCTIPHELLQETSVSKPYFETNDDLLNYQEDLEAGLKACNTDKALVIERLEKPTDDD